jgi:hypothetical protein
MSTQGATLGRGSVRLPMWPVAALVAAAAAVTIGVTMIDSAGQEASSTTAIREQVIVGISHATPRLQASVGYSGLENPGAYISDAPTYAPGLENQGASDSEAEFTPTVTWHRPVI